MFGGRETGDVVSRVVGTFLPERLCIIQFISHSDVNWNWTIEGHRRKEKMVHKFDGYNFVFASFVCTRDSRDSPE